MNHEQTFRVILIAIFMVILPIGIYQRLESEATREKLDRRQEGLFILSTLRPLGAAFWLGLIAWMINPGWMAWSSVSLPVWLRSTGVGVTAMACGLLVWTFRSLGKNLVASDRTGNLQVVDVRKGSVIEQIHLGKDPNQMTLTRDGGYAFVPLRGENQIAVVSLDPLTLVKKIPSPKGPHDAYTTEDGSRIYVGAQFGNAITVIDPATLSLLHTIATTDGVRLLEPSRDGQTLYAALSNLMGFADLESRPLDELDAPVVRLAGRRLVLVDRLSLPLAVGRQA